jgi:hypothetical protein
LTEAVTESDSLDVLRERERVLREKILNAEYPTLEQVEEHRKLVRELRRPRE